MPIRYDSFEGSKGSKALFEQLWPQAVLFKLPKEAANIGRDISHTSHGVAGAVEEWIEDGIMPFPLTATEFFYDPHNYENELPEDANLDFNYIEQVVFWMLPDQSLKFVAKLMVCGEDRRSETYITMFCCKEGWTVVDPTRPLKTERRDGKTYEQVYSYEAALCLSRLMYLVRALQSVEHSATTHRLSRNEARATNSPREHYEIHIRARGSRSTQSTKAQFAEVVRAAHAVRAHKREEHLRQYKSGKIAVVSGHKVSAHIRGRGDAVQLRDYVVDPIKVKK